MSDIYIIGHKNPDTDSIASAIAYAELKNQTDKSNKYIAARCGNMNTQTKFIMETTGATPPKLIKDVYSKVEDIMTTDIVSIAPNEPVFNTIKLIQAGNIRVIPVIDENQKLMGVIGSPQILSLLIKDDLESKPEYILSTESICKVIDAKVINGFKNEEFKINVNVAAMDKERSIEYLSTINPSETLLVVGSRRDIISHAIAIKIAAIVITGEFPNNIDISQYDGKIFQSSLDSAEIVRRLSFATTAKHVMTKTSTLSRYDYVDSVKDAIIDSELRAMPVIDDNRVVGIVTRSSIVKKHSTKVILMDHNEPTQAVDGIETATIMEIIDHHRLGTLKTNEPLSFYAKPVGSTCTLVYQLYKLNNVVPTKLTAKLLMSGIITDTVMLKSPTTTQEDKVALKELEKVAEIEASSFWHEILGSTASLASKTTESIILTDFKKYSEHGISFGVGQVEIVNIQELETFKEDILKELEKQANLLSLNWALLLVTDIIKGDSILLSSSFKPGEEKISYRKIENQCYSLPGVLSRKKQLLPEVLRVVNELA